MTSIVNTMYDALIKHINSHIATSLTASQEELIKVAFIHQKIRKGEFLLREGQICKYSAFLVKGAMRQYTVDEKGVEHIIRLMIEDWWAVDRESFVMHTPSAYYIDAWEDTDVLLISKAGSLSLPEQIPAWTQWTRKLDENYVISTQRRLNASISLPAERRYIDFEDRHPEFVGRFPQHIIASYLGITKETLSRVRRLSGQK